MRRYIDVDALGIGKANRSIFEKPEFADGWNSAVEMIENAPTADVVEVKHGKWIKASCSEKDGDAHCSECNHWDWSDCKYCSECGAKMDGD